MDRKKDQDIKDKTVEFKSPYAFLMVPAGSAHDKKLLDYPKAILLLGEIVSMLNVTQSFYASNKEMARRLNCDPRTIQNYLNLLESEKLIVRDIKKTEKGEVKGRKIYAGEKLGEMFTQGWKAQVKKPENQGAKDTPSETHTMTPSENKFTPHGVDATTPHGADATTPTKHNSRKYNRRIEQDNRTVTNSVSVNKKREKQYTQEFEEVWSQYPKKQGKKDALRHYIAWRKQSENNTNEFLIKKINEYKRYISYNNIEYRFIKNGSTWFNGGYEDDYSLGENKGNDTNMPEDYGYDELFGND